MCQYHRRCPTERHRPGTRCRYVRNRVQGGAAVLAVAVVATVAVTGWNPSRSSETKRADGDGQRPRQSAATIVRIVDGDTVVAKAGGKQVRVRLLGINTPEVSHGQEPGECFGQEATDELAKLAPTGTEVALVADASQSDVDQYGRWLRYVEVVGRDGLDVGRELVRSGAAEVYDAEPNAARESAYRDLQEVAEKAGRGQWGSC